MLQGNEIVFAHAHVRCPEKEAQAAYGAVYSVALQALPNPGSLDITMLCNFSAVVARSLRFVCAAVGSTLRTD